MALQRDTVENFITHFCQSLVFNQKGAIYSKKQAKTLSFKVNIVD